MQRVRIPKSTSGSITFDQFKRLLIFDILKKADRTLIYLSKELIQLAVFLANGSPQIEKLILRYKCSSTNVDQWANRLSEFAFDPKITLKFQELVDAGIEPEHAFNMIIDKMLEVTQGKK